MVTYCGKSSAGVWRSNETTLLEKTLFCYASLDPKLLHLLLQPRNHKKEANWIHEAGVLIEVLDPQTGPQLQVVFSCRS
jgi:hypothetical protein